MVRVYETKEEQRFSTERFDQGSKLVELEKQFLTLKNRADWEEKLIPIKTSSAFIKTVVTICITISILFVVYGTFTMNINFAKYTKENILMSMSLSSINKIVLKSFEDINKLMKNEKSSEILDYITKVRAKLNTEQLILENLNKNKRLTVKEKETIQKYTVLIQTYNVEYLDSIEKYVQTNKFEQLVYADKVMYALKQYLFEIEKETLNKNYQEKR